MKDFNDGNRMSDFKDFFDKVLVSIRNDEYAPSARIILSVAPFETTHPDDRDPGDVLLPDELRHCYSEVMNRVLTDAARREELVAFTDVLAEKLADVALSLGPRGAGDIVRRLGAHLERIGAEHQARMKGYEASFLEERLKSDES